MESTNNLKRKASIKTIVLLSLISIGPTIDQLFQFSMFSRDPAPEKATLIANIVISIIYIGALYLYIQKRYWAKWISFSVYLVWFVIAILIYNVIAFRVIHVVELFVRGTILLLLFLEGIKSLKSKEF